jgi:DNA primase
MPSIIEEIKQKVDIIEVVSQYTNLTKAGRNFRALCPFHSEKNPSFFVYPERQSWHCFGACATGGDVFSFIMKKQNIDFGEALRLLAEQAGITIPSRSGDRFEVKRKDELERLYEANEAASQYFHNLLVSSSNGEKARDYLASRSVSSKTMVDFQLGFSIDNRESLKKYLMKLGYTEGELLQSGLLFLGDDGKTRDRFRNNLMFPIVNDKSRTIGFGARVLDDSLPKYINSPQTPIFDKSATLYGINMAMSAIKQQDLAVIVEGYLDVIIAHQNGFENVVASMGTALGKKNTNILKRFAKTIALALDADEAGEDAWLRFIRDARTFDINVRLVILPRGRDPDDVIKEDPTAWKRLVSEARTVTNDIDYVIDTVVPNLDTHSAKGKSTAVEKLLPIIAEIRDPIAQDHYVQKMAKMVGITPSKMESSLSAYMARNRVRRLVDQRDVPSKAITLLSNPVEEYCLTLLLQYPQFKDNTEGLLPDYFENSENREIFIAFQKSSNPALLKEILSPALQEHFDKLMNKNIQANILAERFKGSVLRLRENYLRGLEAKREAILTLEVEAGGTDAELAKLKELGIDVSLQLGEVFTQKARRSQKQRR